MCLPCFIYAYVIKRDSQVLVKGLSYDKKNWFLLPKDQRDIEIHPEICKYAGLKKLVTAKKVGRCINVRITKLVRSIYENNGKLVWNGKLLERDDNLKENSILNLVQEEEQERTLEQANENLGKVCIY